MVEATLLAQSKDGLLKVYHCPQLISEYILLREGRQSASSNGPDYPLQLLAEYERWVEHQASWNKWMTWQKLND